MPPYVVITMVVIVLALAAYAGWLLLRLARQRRQQRSLAANDNHGVQDAAASSHRLGNRESIRVLAHCLLQGQVSSTEAAIRITALSRALPEAGEDSASYSAFAALANATAHIPILEEWSALEKARKKDFDKERAGIEQAHEVQVMAAARALVTVQ